MSTVDPRPALIAWPPRRRRLVAGVPAGVLACWQAAALLAVSAVGRPVWYMVSAAGGVTALIATTGWRRRGRWASEWIWLGLRYRARRRIATADRGPADLALLDLAGQVLGLRETDSGTGAVVEHRTGGTAVLELSIDSAARVLPEMPYTLTPPWDGDAPPVSVQLIVHTRPIPAAPEHARAWLAVQARRGAGHSAADLREAVTGAVRRVQRHARRTGLAVRPLDGPLLREALHIVSRLELAARARAGAVGAEQWRTWWTGDVPQRCLRVRSWPGGPPGGPPGVPPGPELYRALLATPNLAVTVATAARRTTPGTDSVAVEIVVRVAERDRRMLDAAVRHLCARLAAAGATVDHLEGRQRDGLAATLPLGGFASPEDTVRFAAG